ncbi:MAG TPA: hypothetical protein VHO06_25320, partial [Polyangia bacterium]|nr:hypothetical protein [Polyangia bacterium]
MSSPPGTWQRCAARFFAEPMVWVFLIGAALFVAHRLWAGDPRVVVVTPGVRAELARQFRDAHGGRAPDAAEMETAVRGWERDEVLYREALRERLDRNDRTVRTALADKLRGRIALGVPAREPTAAELDGWLATHRSLYEEARRYDYGAVSFPKADFTSPAALAKYEHAVETGADPRTLGRPIVGGDLTDAQLRERLGPALAAQIEGLPLGKWRRLETGAAFLLVRLDAVTGGLPSPQALHLRLVADWKYAEHQREIDRAVQALVDRYRVEESPR